MILAVCDRFDIDPDTAGELDASTLGLIDDERALKAEGWVPVMSR